MAKRFKLQFSRVIPSFQFCRPKQSSTLPAIYRLSPVNPKAMDITYPNFPNPPPSTPQDPTPVHPSIKRHVSSKTVSVGCGCRSKSCARYLASEFSSTELSPDYAWTRDGKWHVVGKVAEDGDKPRRKIYSPSDSGDTDDDVTVTPLLNTKRQVKKHKSAKKKNAKTSVRTSISSGDSGWFTSEENDDEETDTLVSSRSFSNDSSYDFNDQFNNKSKKSSKIQTKSNAKMVRKQLKRHASKNLRGSLAATAKTMSPEPATPVRTTSSVFRRMMSCKVDGKVMMESAIAVEKKSEDPYEDFKRSMLEMILEKQMFDARDLEELLHCFLSLNSRHHHGVIVEAFSEIWEVLFSSKSPMNGRAK